MNLNIINIIGRVGTVAQRDVNGTTVIQLSVAIPDDYKDKKGEWVKVTHWIRVERWNPIESELKINKGDLVFVSGKIAENSYDKDGSTVKYNLIKAIGIRKLEK